ncbi:MAG TPA: HAMP domain-containing sensor histidine kinase [Actinomycetales bacterium]|jgi:signal transduction histidine kinase
MVRGDDAGPASPSPHVGAAVTADVPVAGVLPAAVTAELAVALPGIDDLPDGVLVADGDAVVTAVNAAAVRVLGVAAADLLGKDVRDVVPLLDTDGNRWWDCTDPWNGLATRTGHREKLLLLPGPLAPREVLVTARYRRPGRSRPVDAVVLGLRDAVARQRTQEAHGLLISTVAHELRSPLTSVKGFSSTLLRRWDRFTDDQKRFMLQTIELDADRVTRLIGELLDISRIDAGRMEVRRQPVDLEGAARRHVERMVASGYEHTRFVIDAVPDLPEVWADPDRVDQVLSNLLENSVRHGAGAVTLTIVPVHEPLTNGAAPSSGVAVHVGDEGDGIADEDLARVFTRFWHGSRRGGTGLGLYLVRGLVEAHGGTVRVQRGAGGGAEFRFVLPAGAPEHVA